MPRNNVDEQFDDVLTQLKAHRPETPHTPDDFRTALHQRLIAQYPMHRRSLRLLPISLGLATLIVVGLLIWFVSPHPVSAAEIISRASQVATNSAAFGLKSYTGTRITWWNNTGQPGQLRPNMQEHLWARVPDLLRDEDYAYSGSLPAYSASAPTLPDPSTPVTMNAIFVNDGTTVWWYHVLGNYLEQHTPAAMPLPRVSSDFQSVLTQLGEDNNNVTQLGSETVAGRDAYVLSFTPKSDSVVLPMTTQIKVWIDKQTYFQLGQENFDSQEGDIVYMWLFSEFKPNVDIDPAMFAYSPPSDAQVVDLRTPKDAADLALTWKTLALAADYKVFRPVNIPTNAIMERPHFTGSPTDFRADYSQLEQEFYMSGQDLSAIVLFENKDSGNQLNHGTPIQIDGYTGEYYEDGGRRVIQFVRDGTWIFLQVDQRLMTKDDILQLAHTMELVPKS